jgi:heavy metal translocating P-type ATPase
MRKIKIDTKTSIAVLALLAISLHLTLKYAFAFPENQANIPLYSLLILGGIPLLYELLKKIISFDFGSDLLAGISIITAIFLEQYLAGSLVVLMLSGGKAIENFALRRASKVLEALAKRAPTTAHKLTGDTIQDISVENIAIGDHIILFPYEICPVDGCVLFGQGVMDESYLTGEPFLISKAKGSTVMSGAINQEASLTIQATKLSNDSRFSKIMQVIQQTEATKPPLRRLADTLGAWYTPIALIIALLAWVFSGDPVRFLSVLVIATPCPLLIAIPVAIIGSISLLASRAILVKNPIILEKLSQCRTMIFDKTGTLTYGKPLLIDQIIFEGDQREILQLVASLERYSKHPLSSAILEEAVREKIPLLEVKEVSERRGEGLQGVIDQHHVVITSRQAVDSIRLPEGRGLECVILVDKKLAAYYRFRDTPRESSSSFIHHLGPYHGFKKLMIISGDRKEEVDYLADYVGISLVYSGKSPEEKVEIVEKETKLANTVYLGDGINDAPALIAATVGIAFGQEYDITSESADAVIMNSSLESVDELLHISERMRKIALQSALGGMGLSIIGMGFAFFGFLNPVAGALLQEMIDIMAIMNGLRTLWKPKILSDL